jgi:hypothetical protein
MNGFRYRLFVKAGYYGFSTSLDRRYSECVSPNGLTYYLKYSTPEGDALVEGYKYNGSILIEQSCQQDTTLLQQKILSRKALQRVPKYQYSFLDDYNLNIVVHESPCTLPNGKRKPRKK